MSTIFFDEAGDPWITCQPNNPEAVDFGPTGVSRPLDHIPLVDLGDHSSLLSAARRSDLVDDSEEDFPVLKEESLLMRLMRVSLADTLGMA